MSLEGLGKDYLQLLSPYLGPYGCMLAMTCKYMKNNIIVKKYHNITEFYERDGHLELLQWCFRYEWQIDYKTDFVPLSILKWKFEKGLHDTFDAFEGACIDGNLDIIDYCISNRNITTWTYSKHFSIKTIDYLYHRKDIILERNIWIGSYDAPEVVYEWAFQYLLDGKISLSRFRLDIHQILMVWISRNFTNIQMMQNYMKLYKCSELIYRLCDQMTYAVARAIPSTQCECRDPANHENRKRIKYG